MGRDKFSALLSELEAKRRTIMSEMDDPQEISAIRFTDTGSKLKPVVVRSATFNKKINVDDDGMRVRRSRVRERKEEVEKMDRDQEQRRMMRKDTDTEQVEDGDEEEEASSSLSKEEVVDDDEQKMKREVSKSSCNKMMMMKLEKNKKKKRKIDQAADGGGSEFVYVGVMALVMVRLLASILTCGMILKTHLKSRDQSRPNIFFT